MHRYYSTYFYTIYAALIVLVPTVMSSRTSELFEFNKILVIYLAAGLVLSGMVWKWLQDGAIRIVYTPLHIAFGIFLFTQLASTFFSIDVQTSLFGYYGRFLGGVTAWTALGILFVGLYDWLTSEQDPSHYIKNLIRIAWVVGVGVVVWGLFGTFGHDLSCLLFTGRATNECWSAAFRPSERMFSTLGQPNWLGAFLSILVALTLPTLDAVYRNFREKKKLLLTKTSTLPTIAACFSFIGIYLTGSRSAQVATILIVVAWVIWRSQHARIVSLLRSRFTLIFSAKVVAYLLAFALLFAYVSRSVTIQPSTSATNSSLIRHIVWKGAFDLMVQHPILGTGPETFAYAYYQVRPLVHNVTSEWDYLYNRAHNEFLNMGATSGLLGFGAYSIMLWTLFWIGASALRKTDKELSAEDKHAIYAMLLAIISICVTNFFGFATTSVSMMMVVISVYILLESKITPKELQWKISKIGSVQALSLASVVGFATVLLVASYWTADVLYARGRADAASNNYGAAILSYKQALQIRDEHVYQEALSYSLANLALITRSSKNTASDQSYVRTLMDQSQALIAEALRRSPNNVIYYRTAARIQFAQYQTTGDLKDFNAMFTYLDTAKKLAPTEPKNYYTAALFYNLALDDSRLKSRREEFAQKALSEIDRAIEMKQDYRDAYIARGNIQTKLGDKTGAAASYQYVLDHINPNDEEAKGAIESTIK